MLMDYPPFPKNEFIVAERVVSINSNKRGKGEVIMGTASSSIECKHVQCGGQDTQDKKTDVNVNGVFIGNIVIRKGRGRSRRPSRPGD